MAQFVSLKCPSCAAPLTSESVRCRYCGVSVLLVSDGSAFKVRGGTPCPRCREELAEGSWFCIRCGYVVPAYKDHVSELHRKERYLQDNVLHEFSEFAKYVAPWEYILYCSKYGSEQYVVTEDRLLLLVKKGVMQEFKWSDVVSVGDVITPETYESGVVNFIAAFTDRSNRFDIATMNGNVTVRGGEDEIYPTREWVLQALRLHNALERDVRAAILCLSPEKEEPQPKGDAFERKYCQRCYSGAPSDAKYCTRFGRQFR